MNNKTIIELFGFRIIWRIIDISEGINSKADAPGNKVGRYLALRQKLS